MTSSSPRSTEDDLLEAFDYSDEELAALAQKFRSKPALSLEDYLELCTQLPGPSYEQLRNRPGPNGERFRL